MSEEQALAEIKQLKQDIFAWTLNNRGSIDDKAIECIRLAMDTAMKDAFACFYAIPTIPKKRPMGSKTRGVSSGCGSLPHTLEWRVHKTLQLRAQSQVLHFPNSVALREENKSEIKAE